MTTTAQEMQLKLAASEESVSNLTAIRKDSEAKLEDTCEHLIKLVDIYQSKEAEMKDTPSLAAALQPFLLHLIVRCGRTIVSLALRQPPTLVGCSV